MGQTTDQIENQIENKREDLRSNLQELETRVKTATEWRHYFAENTGTMIAAAFGGGVLLATMVGGRSNRASLSQAGGSSEPAPPWTRGTKHEVLENLDSIKSALVGAAAPGSKAFLAKWCPALRSILLKLRQIAAANPHTKRPAVFRPHTCWPLSRLRESFLKVRAYSQM